MKKLLALLLLIPASSFAVQKTTLYSNTTNYLQLDAPTGMTTNYSLVFSTGIGTVGQNLSLTNIYASSATLGFTTGASGGGVSVYPATATASFPFGAFISTPTFYANNTSLITGGAIVSSMTYTQIYSSAAIIGDIASTYQEVILPQPGSAPNTYTLFSSSSQISTPGSNNPYLNFSPSATTATFGLFGGGVFQSLLSGANIVNGSNSIGVTSSGGTSVSGLFTAQGASTFISSETVNGANGLLVKYQVNAGSMTGAGLTSCSGGSNAVTWNSTTNQFGCNTISGGGSGGYAVQPATVAFILSQGVQASTGVFTSSVTVLGAFGVYQSSQANIIQLSSSTTGIPLVSVSSVPALAPTDYSLTISSQNASLVFGVQYDGHIVSSGTTPSMGTCGSSPSVSGSDTAGLIAVGSGSVTSCTMNFANSYLNPPVCVESDTSTSVTADIISITTAAVTFGFSSSLGGGSIWYICIGQQG